MIRLVSRAAAWLVLAIIVFVTVSPIELRPHDFFAVNLDRAAAFALLACLFVFAYPKSWFIVGLAIVVSAGGVELLQELSPTRHAQVADAIVKAAGASAGVLAGWIINKLIERRASHNAAKVVADKSLPREKFRQ